VLERRRELALLRAVGYRPRDFRLMLVAETGSLLIAGLVVGTLSASLAIAPALLARGAAWPVTPRAILLVALVAAAGLLATMAAARAAMSGPLLESLKSE
jgi:ABC-type antimicrobial peptide transport system permease subunit